MLRKTLRLLLVMAILLPLFGMPGQARADCAAPIMPGDWHTKPDQPVQYLLDINIPLNSDITFTGQIEITAQANLNVQCDGGVTGTISKIVGAFDYSVAGVPGACSFTGDYHVKSGKVVVGAGGQPLFKLDQTEVQGSSFKCDTGSFPATNGIYDFELQATKSNANRVEGTKDSGEKDPFYQYIRLLQSNQGNIDWSSGTKLTVGWDLYNDAETPIVTDAKATYDIYFLRGITATNDLVATVDWKQSTPDKVNFKFQGNTVSIQTGGPTAEWTYNMADLQAGLNPVIITATDSKGLVSPEYLYNFHGVALPEWAKPAGLTAAPQGSNILYSGQLKFPKQPFSKMVSLPAFIPVVGGNWGIAPIQFTGQLRANSSGAPSSGPLTGTGGLALGGDVLKLETSGQMTAQLTEEELRFISEDSYANLVFDPKPYTKQIGIVNLVPGATSLYGIPVVGDLIKALNAIISVNVSVDPALSGKAFIGVDPADNGLTFTSGQATSDLVLSLLANINIGLASAYAGGGGKGSLTINVAAPPSVAACYVKLFFTAGAKVAGLFGGGTYGPYNKDWDVAQCSETALLNGKTQAVLAQAVAPGALRIDPRPTGWQPERAALKSAQNNQITETVLAENANPEAGPVLVANPDGRLALVWMSEDAAKPRQQAMEILARIYDGKAWSDPIHITTDTHLDATPAAGFDRNGKLVVTWMMNKTEALGADAAFDQALAQQFEIAYAVVAKNGNVETTGKLTDDNIFDFNPQMTAAPDRTLWAVWQSSPGTNMIGTSAAPNRLLAARWDGTAWSTLITISDALKGTLFWKVAANSADDLRVAADMDTDGDLATANDREIVLFVPGGSRGWAPLQVTHNNIPDTAPLLAFDSGKMVLGWLSGKQVVGVNGDPGQKPQVWLDESAGVSAALGNGSLLAGPGGGPILVWADTSPLGADIWFSQRGADGKWSAPAAQFSTPHQRKALTAALATSGDLLLGMARVQIVPLKISLNDGSSMSVPAAGPNADLVMAHVPGVMKTQTGFDTQTWGPYIVGAMLCLLCLGTLALAAFTLWYLRSRRKV